MAKTINYDWDLPSPRGLQLGEIAKIATTFTAIDVKIKSFETALSTHKHAFADLTNKPTTLGGFGITDGMTADEVAQAIKSAVDNLVNGSGEALDTLKELADALGNDPNFAASVGTALGVRVRVDAATNFSLAQRAQGRANIDSLGTVDKGAAGGVASLDAGGKVPAGQLPALTTTATVGAAVAGANGKTTPAEGDFFTGVEAGGSTMFKTTWGNIKTALSAIFIRKAGDVLTGSLGGIAATTSEDWLASFWADSAGGAYANVPKRRVPFKAQTTTIGNSYAPVLNATYNTSAWGGVWTQGVINVGNNAQATSYQLIHMHNDGQAQKTFTFTPSGEFRAEGDIRSGAWMYAGRVVSSGDVQAAGVVYAGGGTGVLYQDGNLSGSRWGGGYLYDWLENRAYSHALTQVRELCFAGRLSLMWVRPGGQINPNDLIAGANLRYAGLAAGGSNNDRVTVQSTYAADGTWRMLGFCGVNPFPQGNYGNLILCAKVI